MLIRATTAVLSARVKSLAIPSKMNDAPIGLMMANRDGKASRNAKLRVEKKSSELGIIIAQTLGRVRPNWRHGMAGAPCSEKYVCGRSLPVHSESRSIKSLNKEYRQSTRREGAMLKTLVAIGLSAGLALSPLAALAQADQTTAPAAPAASSASKAKPAHRGSHRRHQRQQARMHKQRARHGAAATSSAPASSTKY